MRINCAKCGHMHDSTVTPFIHDIIKPILEPKNHTGLSSTVATGSFKCLGCGNENEVGIMWTVLEKEEKVSDELEDTDRVF